MKQWKISICGCSLADNLYTNIDFDAEKLAGYFSKQQGDGGIAPGKLVFAEDLEKFASKPYNEITKDFSETGPDTRNLGGPAIVGAINAAQLLYRKNVEFLFYGYFGSDESGNFIRNIVERTPLNIEHYLQIPGPTAVTDVLSDPRHHGGKGERSFINRVGISGDYTPEALGDTFFDSDILWFAATALVPQLHDNLDTLLEKGKKLGRINVVSTVFDFRNEKKDPVGAWPLGKDSEKTYKLIDLLIMDCEEALRMSGTKDIKDAADFMMKSGVSSFYITHGAKNFYCWSDGRLFRELPLTELPVSALVDEELAKYPERRGDTTGCGDNFAGGLVASLIEQLTDGCEPGEIDPLTAAGWAAASGGAACFQIGGTCIENAPGEKRRVIEHYVNAYQKQIGTS